MRWWLLGLGVISLAGCTCQSADREGRRDEARKERRGAEADRDDRAARGKAKAKAKTKGKVAKAEPREAPVRRQTDEPLLVFLILDTARAASMSLCGYDRPTTPFLERLVKRDKVVSHTCEAYSSGTWTVPSHASYFTGQPVPVHGNDSIGLPFATDDPMLAEILGEQGYQTVMLSANPAVSRKSGLQEGFDLVRTATDMDELRGDAFAPELREVLGSVDPAEPLFLFLNLIDAHDPWPAIPDDVGWVPPRERVDLEVHAQPRTKPYHRYVRGNMTPEDGQAFVEHVTDVYDYGMLGADRNVDAILDVLREDGWLDAGFRMVITSDHGEFLGEHGLLRHGCFTWQPVTRVPFVFYDSAAVEAIELPEPFSAMNAYWLLKDGELPDEPVPVASYSKERGGDLRTCADMAALWKPGHDKLVWQKGDTFRFDLAADPGELNRLPIPAGHPHKAELDTMAAAHAAHLQEIRGQEVDPELVKSLEALGYIQ